MHVDVISNSGAGCLPDVHTQVDSIRPVYLSQDIFPRERQTPEALGAMQKADAEKWWPIIKEAGIKGE